MLAIPALIRTNDFGRVCDNLGQYAGYYFYLLLFSCRDYDKGIGGVECTTCNCKFETNITPLSDAIDV